MVLKRAQIPGRGLTFPNGVPDGPTRQFLQDQNDQLNQVDLVGEIRMFAGSTTPTGWLVCNGQAVSRTLYARLYDALGVAWGAGDGSTTFNLPDLRGRFPIAVSGSHALASSGGSDSHTLTEAELPAINPVITDPGHVHTITDPQHHHASVVADSNTTTGTDAGGVVAGNTADAATGITGTETATTGISIAPFGGGQSFSILPPFAAVNFIIRAG